MTSSGRRNTGTETRTVGRYVLCDEIASGGMATVHLGRLLGPVGFARTVAIKRLHPQFAKDPEFVAMFLDEARIAARVRHPNVASTLDVVVLKGELFVVMEYVHGESLSKLIRASRAATGGGVPVHIAMTIVANALYGLHAAHEATNEYGAALDIVHRDVSPQNILVGQDGVPRVVDFGVAKATDRLQTTREGALKGKLSYMSPEQVNAEAVDRRTDIYAASVVLWEMLTGQRLFNADSEVGIMRMVLDGVVRPPSSCVDGIPLAVDAVVQRGLARNPDHRFATAAEMAEAVQRIAFATPGQVGAWVKSLGGDALQRRAAKVAFIESNSAQTGQPLANDDTESTTLVRGAAAPPPIAPPPIAPPAAPSSPSSSAATTLQDRAAPRVDPEVPSQVSTFNVTTSVRRARVPLLLALAVPALSIVGLAAIVLVRAAREDASTPAPAATSAASADAPATAVTSAAPAVPAETATVAASAAATSAPSSDSRGAPSSDAKPATKRPSTRGRSCNPPYTIDARGIRVPKMECL
jgi:serine/threonine-protein kinase